MSENGVGTAIRAVPEILARLGFGGVALVLWTAVLCAALVSVAEPPLMQLWTYLYWTWVALAAVWFLGWAVAVWRARGATPPTPTNPSPPVAMPQPSPPAPSAPCSVHPPGPTATPTVAGTSV